MPFVARPPDPALAPWVARVWHADLRVPYRSEKILPTPTVELMLNFGDPFDTRSGEAESVRQERGWVCGVQRRYLHNTPLGRTHMVGVRFRPGCAAPFLGLPLAALEQGPVPLEALWPDAEPLRDALWHAGGVGARLRLLERHLLTRLDPERLRGQRLVRRAIAELAAPGRPQRPIAELGAALGVGHRRLIARFHTHVGVTPKQLERIVTFQRALLRLDPRGGRSLTEVAHAGGYYDQAHFNRDFRRFAGMSPGAYLGRLRAHFGPDGDDGERQFVPVA